MGMTPDEFFDVFVLGNYEDFLEREDCLRRAFNAAVAASHMTDHYYNYCYRYFPKKVSQFPKLSSYKRHLSKKSPFFNDIQSIANAYKHLYQKKPHKPYVTVSSAATIEVVKTRNLEILAELPEYVVYKNVKSGRIIKLSTALQSLIDMWRKEIKELP